MANRRILTVFELAEHLNVHRITIYRLLKSGNLPGFKIGRVWRFDLDEITQWMESGKSSPDTKVRSSDGRPSLDGHPPSSGHADVNAWEQNPPLDGNRPADGRVATDGKVSAKPPRGQDGPASRPPPKQDRRGGKAKR